MSASARDAASLCAAGFDAQQRGDNVAAIDCFRRAVALEPHTLDVRFLLVYALGGLGHCDAARATIRETPNIAGMPAGSVRRVADIATDLGEDDTALRAVDRALEFTPDDPDLHATRGALLHRTAQDRAAQTVLDAAVARWPGHVASRMNRARLRADLGEFSGALHDYDSALRVTPDHAPARRHRGLVRLTLGDHAGGWADHEARRALPTHRAAEPSGLPRWDGRDLCGQRVLLWGEQGLGDQIMGVRFAAQLAERGAKVVVQVHPSLLRVLRTTPGASAVHALGSDVTGCDVHVPMLSVPALLGMRDEGEYGAGAYLQAPDKVSAPLPSAAHGERRVAVVWAGSAAHGNDQNRSLPVQLLPALLDVPDVRWISVQLGPRSHDLGGLSPALRARVTDVSASLHDFADTAGVLRGCDAVVTVDTSVAHLAGALGITTCIMLPFAPDWRWGLARSDSPWYGSVHLVRQPAPEAWTAVIAGVHEWLSHRRE